MMAELNKKRLCIVPVCKGERFELVHKFPMDNGRALLWKNILKVPELENMSLDAIRKRYFVCSRHFKTKEYKHLESRSLNKTALPSINITCLDDPEGIDRRFTSTVTDTTTPAELDEVQRLSDTNIIQVYHQEGHISSEPSQNSEFIPDSGIYCLDVDDSMIVKKVDLKPVSNPKGQVVLQRVILPKKGIKRPPDVTATPPRPMKIFKQRNLQPQSDMQTEAKGPVKVLKIVENPQIMSFSSSATQTEAEEVKEAEITMLEQTQIPPPLIENNPVATTKVLALFECTPENLSKLQKKLQESDGNLINFNGDLFNENEEKQKEDSMDESDVHLTIKNHETDKCVNVNYFWLRDHCRCKLCYNFDTNQRSLSILDIPSDIKPEKWDLSGSDLHVTWIDGHLSTYPMDFIFASQIEMVQEVLQNEKCEKVLWDNELITKTGGYARVNLNNLLCDDAVVKEIVVSLIKFGVAFIEKVPANPQSTEMAVKRIFPVQKTLFGEMWTFSDSSSDHSDTAYTKDFLGLHTDNTYFNDAAGLQILHCIQFNGDGGETILADGFKAIESLKEKDNEAFERLCVYPLPAEYIEEGKHHTYCAPVIKKHPVSGDVEQLRFNVYDRSVLNTLPSNKIGQFYSDYRKLAAEINAKENSWTFRLTPGSVMIFDNWRVLHGRQSYTGKRVLSGCYVARTEYLSAARTMKVIS